MYHLLLIIEISRFLERVCQYAYLFLVSGICLVFYKRHLLVDSYNCSHFESGCPTSSFVSYKLFERKFQLLYLQNICCTITTNDSNH